MNIEHFYEEYARGGGRAGGSIVRGGTNTVRNRVDRTPVSGKTQITPPVINKQKPTSPPKSPRQKEVKKEHHDKRYYYYNYPSYPYYYPTNNYPSYPYYYPTNNFPYDYPYYYPYYNYPRYDYETPNTTQIIVNSSETKKDEEVNKKIEDIKPQKDEVNENNKISTQLIIIISILILFLIILTIYVCKRINF